MPASNVSKTDPFNLGVQANGPIKALFVPAYTTAELAALTGAEAGLVVFNSTTGQLLSYNGTKWDSVEANGGVASSAQLLMANQPTAGDTIGIGADTYEFKAAAASLANDNYIAVLIGASAAATRANLIAAINATDADNAHASIFKTNGTTPAKANGTVAVRADEVGTTVRIRSAAAAGSTVILGVALNAALAEAITDAADIWNVGNVNLNTLAGAVTGKNSAKASLTVTAAMVTNGYEIDFPFTVTGFMVQIRTATGVIKLPVADTFTIANGGVKFTPGGQVGDVAATDVIIVNAWA